MSCNFGPFLEIGNPIGEFPLTNKTLGKGGLVLEVLQRHDLVEMPTTALKGRPALLSLYETEWLGQSCLDSLLSTVGYEF